MIGQDEIKKELVNFIASTKNCTGIVCGEEGSGKKTLVREVLKEYSGVSYIVEDTKKETITDLIEQSYKINTPTVYVIPDIDNMSIAAMNSLLKITEEPPNDSKIILTCSSLDNVLGTIQSRALKFYMAPYFIYEIEQYYWQAQDPQKASEKEAHLVCQACRTPGDVNVLLTNGVTEFYDYVQLVFDNVDKVSGTNALKIGSKIAFKDSDTGFDLKLFFTIFERLCLDAYLSTYNSMYSEWVMITHSKENDLRIKGINKSALFDTWILEIRRSSVE